MKHIQNLFALYNQPHRYYHNFGHIVQMLEVLNRHTKITPELYTAVLYHDAIYDPKRDDNELQSALLYELHCDDMGDRPDEKVIQMILDTKEHIPTIDVSKFLIDADLWVLGSNFWTYSEYKISLKKEYEPFFTEKVMVSARTAFLKNMLAREKIFYTPDFQQWYGAIAKTNLDFELRQLRDKKIIWEPKTHDLRRPPVKGIIKNEETGHEYEI